MTAPIGITELHLHLEGSVFPASAIELAKAAGHPWSEETVHSLRRRFRYSGFDGFLLTIREMCSLLCSTAALERTALELSLFLGRFGVGYAEIYVSPYIYMRAGIGYEDAVDAVIAGFELAERAGGARSMILLDSVRQWGPDAALALLEAAAAHPRERVIGFGLGGSETPPLEDFIEAFQRAGSLGLRRVVHAGETGEGDDVRKAVEVLEVERIAHGIRALESPRALALLRESGVALDLAVTSNYRTRVVTGEHPIRRLIDEQITTTLSTDDPSLFRTDPIREYERARRFGRLSGEELYEVARNGIEKSFATEELKDELRRELASRRAAQQEKI